LKVQDLPRPDALDAAEQTPHLLLISERDPGDTRTPLLGLGPHLQKDHGGGFIYKSKLASPYLLNNFTTTIISSKNVLPCCCVLWGPHICSLGPIHIY